MWVCIAPVVFDLHGIWLIVQNTFLSECPLYFIKASTSEMETAARFVQELLHHNPQTETQNPHSGGHDFTQTRHSGIPTSSSPIGQGHQVGSQSPQFEGQISPYGGQSPPFSGQGSQSAMEFYYPVVENPDHRSSPQMLPVMEMGFPQGQGQGQCYMHDPGATSQGDYFFSVFTRYMALTKTGKSVFLCFRKGL